MKKQYKRFLKPDAIILQVTAEQSKMSQVPETASFFFEGELPSTGKKIRDYILPNKLKEKP